MTGWQRVRQPLICAFGCRIPWPEWAYFGKNRMTLCELCAAKYGLTPPLPASREVAP